MLALIAAAVTASPALPATSTLALCRPTTTHAASPPPVRGRKLGELPPGVLQLAVDKRVGGCSVTVLPTRDAQGNHHMILRGRDMGVIPAERPLRGQRRPDAGR